jgi:hypothetical protein
MQWHDCGLPVVIDNQFYDDLFMKNFEIVYAFISIIN